ncbi:MAG: hypothetical protein ACTHJ5_07945 [Ilyomonas sp.]
MKKQTLALGLKRIVLASGLAIALTTAVITSAKANTIDTTKSNIEYVGTTNKGIVFNVAYDNPTGEKFELVIKNAFGDIVFQQRFDGADFSKKVVLVKEPGDAHLTFAIRTPNKEISSQSFDISTTARVVEDVVVKARSKK